MSPVHRRTPVSSTTVLVGIAATTLESSTYGSSIYYDCRRTAASIDMNHSITSRIMTIVVECTPCKDPVHDSKTASGCKLLDLFDILMC